MSKKMNILCVDDDMINLKLLTRMLNKYEDIGEIYTAYNGVEARLKVREHDDIDLILLDIMMPIMTGLEFLEFRADDEMTKKIPVIVLTTDESKKNEALDNGATDFSTKPIREIDLFEKIDMMKELYD